jgi:hypothetical protein
MPCVGKKSLENFTMSSIIKLCFITLLINGNLVECLTSEFNHNNSNNNSRNGSHESHETCTSQFCDNDRVIMSTLDYLYNDMKRSNEFSIHKDRLLHSSIVYGLISLADKNELNMNCFNNLNTIQKAIHQKEIWAMKSKFFFNYYSTEIFNEIHEFQSLTFCRIQWIERTWFEVPKFRLKMLSIFSQI